MVVLLLLPPPPSARMTASGPLQAAALPPGPQGEAG